MALIALQIAAFSGLACWGFYRYAMSIPLAAGAGATGSILLLISGFFGLISIFMAGVSLGFALHA